MHTSDARQFLLDYILKKKKPINIATPPPPPPTAQKEKKSNYYVPGITSSFLALSLSGQMSPRALLGERFSQVEWAILERGNKARARLFTSL